MATPVVYGQVKSIIPGIILTSESRRYGPCCCELTTSLCGTSRTEVSTSFGALGLGVRGLGQPVVEGVGYWVLHGACWVSDAARTAPVYDDLVERDRTRDLAQFASGACAVFTGILLFGALTLLLATLPSHVSRL